ncbi:hypothetical protein Syn7803C76_170 [Synechococcus phage ACG-2014b]|jgi:hypothetical protein|uniref:DUF7201 domain-containing protein n=2 Tax=Synechococcus phage ACG-2014b TaxID=1493508 RepID=A0A0E3IAY2_9CAUD|nr:hypothetical protein ABF04_gp170 [Synechococcus phage ACG-2014b]YP_009779796.1 hypothetical protein HOQ67_gp168 [Synechococcus phage ACG-2014b]YP_009780014.1 hypothetical protein HOQ68_gp171 [Synechococcus phage ACG-2014b]AIX17390.1 hypothetical protein Syn7803C61_168 [Synechococcus phage ACG-2014b]AIX17605.1 hypothetical protein Syn7803C66_168 [Synechococcus phage ACG-2014b]AIX17821.1 hypothetical protein Syn7803C67_169 [Synechococcus phage ACG-2014b]AIX18037.1 hypothetical protein Syn780
MEQNLNTAIIERLEKVVDSLQDNSIQMGKLLAVHNEKLDNQDQVDNILFEKLDRLSADLNRETAAIKQGCERDIRLVDARLRALEKKMWSIAGALTMISVFVSPIGQKLVVGALTSASPPPVVR